ncbi:MAG TPA: glycosyltransferase family A protein [Chlamydiales bacterium]|nr:glycosyltransferase family A protein [Chlamydiales bacterium]
MKIFYFISLLAALLCGYWMGKEPRPQKEKMVLQDTPHPEIDFPLQEEKSFVLVIYAYKNGTSLERALKSIFEQDYENFRVIFYDDHSEDGTFENVQSFVLENKQEHRVILIKNPERIGPIACLYRATTYLQNKEIVIPLDVKDWLAHSMVLSHLNAVYQNPDVWLTTGCALLYPSYEKARVQFEDIPSFAPISFYVALFKQIRLADLMSAGRFAWAREVYLEALLQMSKGRQRMLDEPLLIANLATCRREALDKPRAAYDRLCDFPDPSAVEEKADIIIFSCDRPLQLFACLESIHRYISGFEQIYVLCRSSDERYLAAYEEVGARFPNVQFVFQEKEYKKDFKPLLLNILFKSQNPYVMFGTDDGIVKDFTNLTTCMQMMSKTGAYGFYLRLGSHISYSYQLSREQKVPVSIGLEKEIYAWNIEIGYSDWAFPNTLDMTLYKKSSLKTAFEKMHYKTPNSLEFCWAKEYPPEGEIGLYFEHSKVVNLPLNIVSRTGNPHMDFLTAPELLSKFEQGFKIDIEPLFRVENASPHFEYRPEFSLR